MNKKLKLEELNRINVEEFKSLDKIPLVVVLDNIRSLNNIGSIFRTSDAFKVAGVYLCGITATPPHKEIHKTALGATESVDWYYKEDAVECVKELKEGGYKILALEQAENKTWLQEMELESDSKYAIVLGNEVFGVDQNIIDISDAVIEIPQEGTKHSLNVSVSAGMIIWESFKQLR